MDGRGAKPTPWWDRRRRPQWGHPSAADRSEATVDQPLTPVCLLHPLRVTPAPRWAAVRPGSREGSAGVNLASDSLQAESLLGVLLQHPLGSSLPSPRNPTGPPA